MAELKKEVQKKLTAQEVRAAQAEEKAKARAAKIAECRRHFRANPETAFNMLLDLI